MTKMIIFFVVVVAISVLANATTVIIRRGNPGTRMETIGRVGSKTFKIQAEDTEITWHEAKEFCGKNGLKLATVNSAAENNLIANYLQKLVDGGAQVYDGYLGGTDEKSRGSWYWVNTGVPFKYNNWLKGKTPKSELNYDMYDACLIMGPGNTWAGVKGYWSNVRCSVEFGRAICS